MCISFTFCHVSCFVLLLWGHSANFKAVPMQICWCVLRNLIANQNIYLYVNRRIEQILMKALRKFVSSAAVLAPNSQNYDKFITVKMGCHGFNVGIDPSSQQWNWIKTIIMCTACALCPRFINKQHPHTSLILVWVSTALYGVAPPLTITWHIKLFLL